MQLKGTEKEKGCYSCYCCAPTVAVRSLPCLPGVGLGLCGHLEHPESKKEGKEKDTGFKHGEASGNVQSKGEIWANEFYSSANKWVV